VTSIQTEKPNDSIVEKIAKLIALSSSPNEHEAKFAAEKAQELLLKYNLEMSDIEARKSGEDVGEIHVGMEGEFGVTVNGFLVKALTDGYFCSMFISSHNGERTLTIIGEPVNMIAVRYLYTYLAREVSRLAKAYRGAKQRESFALGFAEEIRQRLQDKLRAATTTSTSSLITIKSEAVDLYKNTLYPNLSRGRAATISDPNAYRSGRSEGAKANLNRPIEATLNRRNGLLS